MVTAGIIGLVLGALLSIIGLKGIGLTTTPGPLVLSMGLVFVYGGITLLIPNKKSSQKTSTSSAGNKSMIGGTSLDRFYVECVLAQCTAFTNEKNIQKAKLIADKYKLSYPDGIEELFGSSRREHDTIVRNLRSARQTELASSESAELRKYEKYAELYGKEKKETMLKDAIASYKSRANILQKGGMDFAMSTQQRELNWGTYGGIASGIAGPAAGVATARDIQNRNAQIRVQNEANRKAVVPLLMHTTSAAMDLEREAEKMQAALDALAVKLVADTTGPEVMDMLLVTSPSVEVTETGFFRVRASVSARKALLIFDDVPAVADGTILAHVMDENRVVGTAKMVLPVDGVSGKAEIIGAGNLSSSQTGTSNKKYSVTFSAYKLWLMEK